MSRMTPLPFAALIAACNPGCASPPEPCEVGNEVGDCASDFTLLDGDETAWTLSENLGSVTIVAFAQLWCAECVQAADDLASIQEEYRPGEVKVFAVYFEDLAGESVATEEVAEYTEENGIPFPVLADTDGAVQEVWGFNNERPNLFVVDDLGVIAERDSGYSEASFAYLVREAIDTALQVLNDDGL